MFSVNFGQFTNWWNGSKPVASSAPKEGIEDGWVKMDPINREIVPFVSESRYTVEIPDDEEPDNRMVVFQPSFKESVTIIEVEDFVMVNRPVVVDIDEELPPSNGGAIVPATLVATAIGAGAAAYSAEVGAVVLVKGVGYYMYSKMVPQGAWAITQYFYASLAEKAATKILATTIAGVGLPAIANVVFTGLTVITVAETGAIVYNACVSKENRIAPGETIVNITRKMLKLS